jgi:polysaccharide biosynthesis/export protein
MRLCHLVVVMLAALALAGCARHAPRYAAYAMGSELDMRMYGAPAAPARAARRLPPSYAVRHQRRTMPAPVVGFADGPYTLDSGDKLRIVVFGQDALSNNYTVDADGRISLPLAGSVTARGMTTAQLAGAIRSRLAQGYIRDPSVAVEMATYRPFFVLGEVTYPGQYPYVPNMTAEQAIAIAGGFTPRASKDRVTITRKLAGRPTRADTPLRTPLRPGDTVTVGERWF